MRRHTFSQVAIFAFIQFILVVVLSRSSLAQEWVIGGPRGTLKVVDLLFPSGSARLNYAEPLVTLDKDNNLVPCLAVDWRWLNDRTIEFKLRKAVTFHNGEKFDAEAVKINWEEYRKMERPRVPHTQCCQMRQYLKLSMTIQCGSPFLSPMP
jgi:ABC-type transport system substrate-binding protein